VYLNNLQKVSNQNVQKRPCYLLHICCDGCLARLKLACLPKREDFKHEVY